MFQKVWFNYQVLMVTCCFFFWNFRNCLLGKFQHLPIAMAMVATASTGRRRSWRTTDLVTSQVSMQSVQSTQSASGQGESFFISRSTISTRVSPIFFRVVSLDYGKPRISRFNFFLLITKKCSWDLFCSNSKG